MENVVIKRLDAIEAKFDALLLQQETMLTMPEAARLVGLCEDKFRRVHTRLVPSYKTGKRVLFKKSEIIGVLDGFKRLDVSTAAHQTLQQAGKRGVA
jgi:hypothetical protein